MFISGPLTSWSLLTMMRHANRVELKCVLRADLYYSCGPDCCDKVEDKSGLNNKTRRTWIPGVGEAPLVSTLDKKDIGSGKKIIIHFCKDEKKKMSMTSACLELTIQEGDKEKNIRKVFQLPKLGVCRSVSPTGWRIAGISISGTLMEGF